MCLSCGCGDDDNDHGNSDNITLSDLARAAEAAGIEPGEAAKNILSSYHGPV
jgi:hypothetical protein